jgi:hypothetical protein
MVQDLCFRVAVTATLTLATTAACSSSTVSQPSAENTRTISSAVSPGGADCFIDPANDFGTCTGPDQCWCSSSQSLPNGYSASGYNVTIWSQPDAWNIHVWYDQGRPNSAADCQAISLWANLYSVPDDEPSVENYLGSVQGTGVWAAPDAGFSPICTVQPIGWDALPAGNYFVNAGASLGGGQVPIAVSMAAHI